MVKYKIKIRKTKLQLKYDPYCSSYKNALYECNWYGSSRRFKGSMIVMMSRMRKPVYLTIGKFFPLTLRTFLVVTKGSFSYATVLKAFD
nr:unnamed protein product [Callosobruchus analis]